MIIAQRAALLDQLKLPIEEAPRDGTWIVGIFEGGNESPQPMRWISPGMIWIGISRFEIEPSHFLPLPTPGPVEFEVVPKGTVRKVEIKGLVTRNEMAERSYLRGLEMESR